MLTNANHRRVLVAKVGLDGHDRGVKIVARALRDAGVEVVYLGIHNTPAEIVSAAVQEDVDAIGLSIHSAAHLTLFKEVMALLKKNRALDVVVFGGGIVPAKDLPALTKLGVKKLFGPGASLEEITEFVNGLPGRKDDDSPRSRRRTRNSENFIAFVPFVLLVSVVALFRLTL